MRFAIAILLFVAWAGALARSRFIEMRRSPTDRYAPGQFIELLRNKTRIMRGGTETEGPRW